MFLGPQKTVREARGLTPWFWARTGLEPGLSRENRLFTLHSQHHSLPQETLTYDILPNLKCLSQGSNLPLQSLPGFEPGASGVRRPCANPLGNLTTVGHLAVVSPDLNTHFQTRKTSFSDT